MMSCFLGSPGQGADRQPCCRIAGPTTHSGAGCRGATAASLNTAGLALAGGLEEREKTFSQWHFCKPPQAHLGPSSRRARGGRGEVGVRRRCPQPLPQPHGGLSPRAEALPQPCHCTGTRHGAVGAGGATAGPPHRCGCHTHLLPHQSHKPLLAPSTDPICGCFHNNLPALSGPFCHYADAEVLWRVRDGAEPSPSTSGSWGQRAAPLLEAGAR